MAGQTVSYIRVSSVDQNPSRQREAVGATDKEFLDKQSAKSRAARPGLDACVSYLRADDVLKVASIDRLARSLVDLRNIIDEIVSKGATVRFLKEGLTFAPGNTDARATFLLGILGSFAEFERELIRERQAEGIALAKKAGKYKGRKRILSPEQVRDVRARAAAGESKSALATEHHVSRSTIYRCLEEPQ
ncbi:recombinase family protein [Corynebacterium senegalense]|uniref:recombinase family protein n=1 Tax=Corynebacterium senegalense TaxID=2080750 RepID=UPI000E20449E|nr:recombinase family protein [Corynebacterium senegalense]